jgi:hypothetical protein
MVKLAAIRENTNLFGAIVLDVWLKGEGKNSRYRLCNLEFETREAAEAHAWVCDYDLYCTKLGRFIESAVYGMSFHWHGQRKWIQSTRPHMDNLRTYLYQLKSCSKAPVSMSGFAGLIAAVLLASMPYKFMTGAHNLWSEMYDLSVSFQEKYCLISQHTPHEQTT